MAAAAGRAAEEGREATGRPCDAWGTGSKSAVPRFVRFFFGRDRERGTVRDGGHGFTYRRKSVSFSKTDKIGEFEFFENLRNFKLIKYKN